MKTQLIMAAVASILLTSAAFAANPGPGSGVPHESRRAGDRYEATTGNQELMCKVAGSQASASRLAPPNLSHAVSHLRQEGDIQCTPSMSNGV